MIIVETYSSLFFLLTKIKLEKKVFLSNILIFILFLFSYDSINIFIDYKFL